MTQKSTIEKRVRVVEELKTAYREVGEGTGLLFLHGWKGKSRTWEANMEGLLDVYKCLALDLPGFGESDSPKETWGVSEYSEFVNSFVNTLKWKQFVLVGKSFGGRVAIKYAVENPERLRALVLVSAAGIEEKTYTTKMKILAAKTGKLITRVLPESFQEEVQMAYYKMFKISPERSKVLSEIKKKVTSEGLKGLLGRIEVPTLVIWGSEDGVLPVRYAYQMAESIPGAKLKIIDGAGHDAHSTHAEEFNKFLQEFVQGTK